MESVAPGIDPVGGQPPVQPLQHPHCVKTRGPTSKPMEPPSHDVAFLSIARIPYAHFHFFPTKCNPWNLPSGTETTRGFFILSRL
jgi:hypothetical protein